MRNIIIALIVMAFSMGCASYGKKIVVQNVKDAIEEGFSKAEVEELMGKPSRDLGDSWKYYYYRGLLSPAGIEKGGHTLMIQFDEADEVMNVSYEVDFWNRELGMKR